MPATFSPIDREAFVALQQGEERTLERLFRDHYAALVEEARPIVGDDASASKVVERAFARAWKERGQFETPETFTAFLHEAVHDQAKVMLHRRVMLHRIEEHEGAHAHASPVSAAAIPVDDAWKHVDEAIHATALDRKALAREQHEHSRHEAAHNMAAVAQPRSWKVPAAIGAAVLAALVVLFWVVDRAGAEKAIVSSVNSPETQVLKSGTGQRGNIPLDDGSKVAIGADSKLFVAPRFGARMRALKLEGTASFTVAPKADMPFHVLAGPAMITAAGTVFLVQAYPGDAALLQVRDGSVEVKRDEETRAVAKGQALVIPATGAMHEPTNAMLAVS
jgi:ferric-dicitrate binding protein FerR (iron transport regulator)